MSIPELSVKRPVMMTMFVMVFVIMGAFSYRRLVVEMFPAIDIPFITVATIYPGAGPKEVETQITDKIEDVVSTISKVKMFQSFSRESISIVAIEFELGVDIDLMTVEVKNKIDAISYTLPDGAEAPSVSKFDINALPIVEIAVSGDRPLNELYELADKKIKDELAKVPGLAQVQILGGLEREIIIAADRKRMSAFGVGLLDLMGALGQANMDMPAGHITESRKEYSIRLIGQFESLEEIEMLELKTPMGSKVLLKDVADVVDGFKEQRNLARFQRSPTVNISIVKRSDGNTIEVVDGVYKVLDRLKKDLPAGVKLDVAKDESTFVRASVADVRDNIIIGIVLASILLYLFLHNVRSTFVVSIVLPTAMISTLLLVDAAGFSLNIMTLMSLGISIGMLVTNAIVVLENINVHIEQGKHPHQAAIDGANEVAVAVAASTLTNIVVFTPIAFMSGIIGQFFKQFGLTTVFATMFSLLAAFTLTPMLASRLLAGAAEVGDIKKKMNQPRLLTAFAEKWDAIYDKIARQYRFMLEWSLEHRFVIILGVFASFGLSIALLAGGLVGGEFFPKSDQGLINIMIKMPPGSSMHSTDRVLEELESLIEKNVPEMKSMLTKIGGENKGVEDGMIVVQLTPAAERTRDTDLIINELRPKFAVVPAAEISATVASMGGPPKEADIELEVYGTEMEGLRIGSEMIEETFFKVAGLTDIKTTYSGGKPEITYIPDRRQMAAYGLPLSGVAVTLRAAFAGMESGVYREAGEEYDIRVQLKENQRDYVQAVEDLSFVAGPMSIPLSQLGQLSYRQSEAEIRHKNKLRQINVQANLGAGTLGGAQTAIEKELKGMELPPGVTWKFGGDVQEMEQTGKAILEALVMAIILTFMILAGIMESIVHPFTIMFTLPLGFVGATYGLFFGNSTINMMSLMAIVMLVGVVVNNAILIIDYTQVLRRRGMDMRTALLNSSESRLKPIIMTNLAIVISMFPQTLGGQAFRATMAITTIGGVLVSAVFTLFLIPVLFSMLDRFAKPPAVEEQ